MKYVLLLFSSFTCMTVLAEPCSLQISEAHILSGGGGTTAVDGSFSDFRSLAPASRILGRDYSMFEPGVSFATDRSSFQSLQLGFRTAKLPKAVLRIGVSNVIQSGLMTRSGFLSESFPYDTLVSSQTGESFFVDSTYYQQFDFRYGNKQLRLDINLLYRLHPEKRWTLQGGIGVTAGYSYAASTVLEYSASEGGSPGWNYNDSPIYMPWGYRNDRGEREVEKFDGKNGFGASVYVPLGIDFRVGKKREFWKPIHLYFETRPSIQLNSVPGRGICVGVGSSAGLGLRVDLLSAQ
ncbi:MAG: hypothetical protein RL213_187 [Bacteroidota bacterium]|jgi:hypothetical protein